MKPGDLVQTINYSPFYPNRDFLWLETGMIDVPPKTFGIVVETYMNKVHIITELGAGWVGEHILKRISNETR